MGFAVSRVVCVDICYWYIQVVVLRAICVCVFFVGVNMWVHFCAYSKSVQIFKVKNVQFLHKRRCVGSRLFVTDDPNDLLLCSPEGLHVLLAAT